MKGTVRQKKIKKKEKRKMGQDRKVRIALGQMKVVQGDTKENLRKMMEMIDQAAEQNVDIICFPELAYTGYFLESEELQKLAEPVDGPFVQTMRKCAKSKGMHIIAGYAESVHIPFLYFHR